MSDNHSYLKVDYPVMPDNDDKFICVNGSEAIAAIAYAVNENCFVYPITPAAHMGEYMDGWIV